MSICDVILDRMQKEAAAKRGGHRIDDSTPEIRCAQERTMESARWTLKQADVCRCARCLAVNHRAHARGLIDLLIESMHYLGQRNTDAYLEALRLRSQCDTELPAYQTANGFAVTAPSPIPDSACVRDAAAVTVKRLAAALPLKEEE